MAAPLFVNEACFPIDASEEEVLESLRSALEGIRRAKQISEGLLLGSAAPLSQLQITKDYRTLASLTSVMDREWWRFVRLLEQYSPFSSMPRVVAPQFHSARCPPMEAATWAVANDAFVLSFRSPALWREDEFEVELCECLDEAHTAPRYAQVRNISSAIHADRWEHDLVAYGECQANSTEIYAGPRFSLRMYLLDHPPAHVHVFLPSAPLRCVGKIRFDVEPEYLEMAGLSDSLKSHVLMFVREKRDQLARSWDRCQSGERPNVIQE